MSKTQHLPAKKFDRRNVHGVDCRVIFTVGGNRPRAEIKYEVVTADELGQIVSKAVGKTNANDLFQVIEEAKAASERAALLLAVERIRRDQVEFAESIVVLVDRRPLHTFLLSCF